MVNIGNVQFASETARRAVERVEKQEGSQRRKTRKKKLTKAGKRLGRNIVSGKVRVKPISSRRVVGSRSTSDDVLRF